VSGGSHIHEHESRRAVMHPGTKGEERLGHRGPLALGQAQA
jgi:hypothetical protein